MSVKSVVFFPTALKEQLDQINFLRFFTNAEVIAEEALKECAKNKLDSIKGRVDKLKEAVDASDFLPDTWLERHVVKTIKLVPKNTPSKFKALDDDDAHLFRDIFAEVRESLKAIRDGLDKQLQKELAQEGALFAEQKNLNASEMYIQQLKTFPATQNQTPPYVYIAYAWPIDDDETKKREGEVQLFLKILENHLKHLGIKAKLDVRHCSKGSSIHEYMKKKIEKSDVFLLFGTESLLRKMEAHGGIPLDDHHAGGYPLICYELGQAYRKATAAKLKRVRSERPVILPVLLTGSMNKSFPEYFQGNLNTILIPEMGYLEGLKKIVYSLYGFQKLGQEKALFEQEWREHFRAEQLKIIVKAKITEKGEILQESREESLLVTAREAHSNSEEVKASDLQLINLGLQQQLEKRKIGGDRLNARIMSLMSKLREQRAENKKILQEKAILNNRVDALTQALQDANEQLLRSKETVLPQAKKIEELQTKPAKNLPEIAFGKADWEVYFGEVGEEPPLPANIEEILKSACPFWPDKRVEETHLLVLVPKTVDGVPLTLNSLSELIKVPKKSYATQFEYYYKDLREEYGDKSIMSSHWTLLTKDAIPNSRNKNYAKQCKLIASYGEYEVPRLIDVAVGIMMHHAKTGERLYTDEPYTYTRCKAILEDGRQPVVGGFSPGGLCIHCYFDDDNYVGVGGSRKF